MVNKAGCEWENVTTGICGKHARFQDGHGKKYCREHGCHLRKRFGKSAVSKIMPATEVILTVVGLIGAIITILLLTWIFTN